MTTITPPTIVLAVSDKGGTGRSVTACNIAYQLSAQGKNVAYLDFDFGSPTSGAIFEITQVEKGIQGGGLHSFLRGDVPAPQRLEVRTSSSRPALRTLQSSAGRLVLFPGDAGGAEFTSISPEQVQRAESLLQELIGEFHVCIVDLSAGRSHAAQIALAATARPTLQRADIRWLVFHRWTRQHLTAAHSLVFDKHGLLDVGKEMGHDRTVLEESIRFVRTAVPALDESESADRAEQSEWLHTCNDKLRRQASKLRLGHSWMLGSTPMEPMLQWQEQIILDTDVTAKIANEATVQSFRDLAQKLFEPAVWEGP
jgi:hypothetical protein